MFISASHDVWRPVMIKTLLPNTHWGLLCSSPCVKRLHPGSDCTSTREEISSLWFAVCINDGARLWTWAEPKLLIMTPAGFCKCVLGNRESGLSLHSFKSMAPPFHFDFRVRSRIRHTEFYCYNYCPWVQKYCHACLLCLSPFSP